MKRKRIAPDTPVEVRFSTAERDLVLEDVLLGLGYMDRLVPVVGTQAQLVGRFTLDDLEDILGYVAAEANHTEDRKLERQLDAIYQRLFKLQRSYDDGAWNDSE